MKRCKQCKKELSEEAFLSVPKGWRVNFCYQCARSNMMRWATTQRAGKFDFRSGYNPAEKAGTEVNQ